ncbi:MAG TPA: hypothetical protein VGJ73_09020 [Verrucomicrobiae bacterium]
MKFFFDNNLAPKIAKGLNGFVFPEHEVIHLKDKFPANTPDVDWMKALAGERDLMIVTGDVRIGKNPQEVLAWKAAGHTIFFLKQGWISLGFWVQAHKFVKCFPSIIAEAKLAQRGSSFIVSVNGNIEG